ncbi:MAG: N-acetyltransferase [Planctomycetes bacterium]|nr:N-acetyltransferase [Planctomycetota bacterium]
MKKASLGKGYQIEKGVVVGYKPGRTIADPVLRIGKSAHIRSGTVIYGGSTIGANLETGHNVVIREENRIGDNFAVWNNSVIDYGCQIGHNVKVHSNVYIAQFTTIEDNVFIAPGVSIANDLHPGCAFSKKCMRGPVIKKGAQIGVNATILPFITIGAGAVIGSGSVVTKDVPPHSVACGNPARVIKKTKDVRCVTGLTKKPYQ